jgi:hypothetical protein
MTVQNENESRGMKRVTRDDNKVVDEVDAWKKRREERRRSRQQRQSNTGDDELDGVVTSIDHPINGDDDDNDDDGTGTSFVPLSKRIKLEREALIGRMAHRRKRLVETDGDGGGDADHNGSGVAESSALDGDEDGQSKEPAADAKKVESLLESVSALHKTMTEAERSELQRREEEARILREASKVQTNALQAASELAKGVTYTETLPSTWTAPSYLLKQGPGAWEKVRSEWHIEVEGQDIPPPCKRFVDMKFPQPIMNVLNRKGIKKPTPIQMQGLTVVRPEVNALWVVSWLSVGLLSHLTVPSPLLFGELHPGIGVSGYDRYCIHRFRQNFDVFIASSNVSPRGRI